MAVRPLASEDAAAPLASVWDQFAPTTEARVALVMRAAEAFGAGSTDAVLQESGATAAHQLAGFVGTFGFGPASAIALEIEALLRLESPTADADSHALLIDRAAALCEALLETPVVAASEDQMRPAAALPLVLLVSDDKPTRDGLSAECTRRGLRTMLATTAADIRAQVARERPSVVVVDLALTDGIELTAALSDTPTVTLATLDDQDHRMAVARAGSEAFLHRSMAATEVIDRVALVIERHAITGTRVLAIDEDHVALERIEHLFASQPIAVHTLTSPHEMWDALPKLVPDLIIVAVTPQSNDLLRLIRSDPRWGAVPVIATTGPIGEAQLGELFAAGASDHVTKPFGYDLVVRARSELERYRLHRALAETDPLTGLPNRRTSSTALGHLLRLSERLNKPVSIAEIDIDHFKNVNDKHGHVAGDAALRRLAEILRGSFRGEDIVARWGGEEFVIGMFDADRAQGVDRLDAVLGVLRRQSIQSGGESFSMTFSAGVAQYPADGDTLQALYQAADEALYAAKRAGRNRVAGARTAGGPVQEVVDVAVVEDDDATAELLTRSLSDAGYKWWRFSTGVSAAAALTGDVARLRARVILLDIDLPALDGFDVLGILARDGVTSTTKVLMLSADSQPATIERAIGLGAVAYLNKPFIPASVIEQVRVLLGR